MKNETIQIDVTQNIYGAALHFNKFLSLNNILFTLQFKIIEYWKLVAQIYSICNTVK